MSAEEKLQQLVGQKIKQIFFNENYLKFVTDKGNYVFGVDGDCCSSSYFYDFYGVKNLLNNGEVKEVKQVELSPTDIKKGAGEYYDEEDKKSSDSSIQVYGYQLTTTNNKFGDVTSVFSFRNYSNGYYGGELVAEGGYGGKDIKDDMVVKPEIFDDVILTASNDENRD